MTKPERAAKRTLRNRLGRVTALTGLVALVLSFSGDRAQGAATILGIDPLEILNLQVKPNVVIVLDSSGSMQSTLAGNGNGGTGDASFSKMGLAKAVLREVIADNDKKASFLFGQYTQANSSIPRGFMNDGGGGFRFTYGTTDTNLTSPTVYNVLATLASTVYPLDVTNANNRIRYQELDGGNNVLRTCTGTVVNMAYTTGAALASAVQTALQGASCSSGARQNTYAVVFDTGGTNRRLLFDSNNVRRYRMLADPATTDIWPDIGFAANSAIYTDGNQHAGFSLTLAYRGNTTVFDATTSTTYALLRTGKFYNGQTLNVLSNGTVCSVTNGTGGDGSASDPFFVNIQRLGTGGTCSGTPTGGPIKLTLLGGDWGGNNISCNGFSGKVPLPPCDTTAVQFDTIGPYLLPELGAPTGSTGGDCSSAATCPIPGYSERPSGAILTPPTSTPATVKADGSTPIAPSLRDIRGSAGDLAGQPQRNWEQLWNVETTPGVGGIKDHTAPRERTLVLFVTDGDDTCAPGTSATGISTDDSRALAAAYQAQLLYDPLEGSVDTDGSLVPVSAGDPDSIDRAIASSVTTYVVNFGTGASLTRSNWIAWGGSGMRLPCNNGSCGGIPNTGRWQTIPTNADRANCKTCKDAFPAPDAETLASVLNGIINQGAQAGLFTAQQSLISTVYEYVAEAPVPTGQPANDPTNPNRRFRGIVPVRYEATFTLPGYQGQVKAYTNDQSDNAVLRWSAGDKLKALVDAGMNAPNCPNSTPRGAVTGFCSFTQLGGNGAIATAAIKRRIYTTSGNGVFGAGGGQVTLTDLHSTAYLAAPSGRVSLWPATLGLVASSALDTGLAISAYTFAELQTKFGVCTPTPAVSQEPAGTPAEVLPAACGGAGTQLDQALLETRQIIVAYAAGAEPYLTADALPRRTDTGEILFKPRDWLLAESTLATPAVVGSVPVIQNATGGATPFNAVGVPADYLGEYHSFAGGSGGIAKGFGLGGDLAVMTVLYVPANDMLHAFRAAQCLGCSDTGGEELWGFVPWDQLSVLTSRFLNRPPQRDPHDYMFSTSVRVAELLVPGSWSIGAENSTNGAWRRILYIGRGVTGKYITALDITGPGDYATPAIDAIGPVPLWSRGNIDTADGTAGGAPNYTTADKADYARMGQTWSVPAIGFVKTRKLQFTTLRRPAGLEFVAFVGSGYGDVVPPGEPPEGQTFFALDPLTGDVAKRLDVALVAASNGLERSGLTYENALVASPAGYVKEQFEEGGGALSGEVSRLYFGDLHGRLWKVLTGEFSTVIPGADLGADQPVAVPVALLGLPFDSDARQPYIFATSGNDLRQEVPFKIWGFHDEGGDTEVTPGAVVAENGVNVFRPMHGNFTRGLDPVIVPRVPPFRGTVQPATVRGADDTGGTIGVALFAAARFNPPGTPEAPLPYPCRSSFDSIVYVLNGTTGAAAFEADTGVGGYVLQKDSRIVGIGTAAAPDPVTGQATTQIYVDEGLKKAGTPPAPPPKKGVPPVLGGAVSVATPGDRNVALFSVGSSVCAQP